MVERLRKIAHALLFPPLVAVFILVPLAAAMLAYSFCAQNASEVVVYLSYTFSVYVLVVICAKVPALVKWAAQLRRKNKFMRRYSEDVAFRVRISLYTSLGMNTLYAAVQLWLGLTNRSFWFYALACYYILLAVMRFFLLRDVRKGSIGADQGGEYRRYRFCGTMLVLMNLALAVIVTFIVWQNRGFKYQYIMTIAMATYTFYTLTMAIVNAVRYRRYQSPVLSAAKAVSLVAAIVSMLSLETAMLAAFGEDSSAQFRQIMTACTGAAVCVIVLTLAVYMIVHSTKQINRLKKEHADK